VFCFFFLLFVFFFFFLVFLFFFFFFFSLGSRGLVFPLRALESCRSPLSTDGFHFIEGDFVVLH